MFMHVDHLHLEIFRTECWKFRQLYDKLTVSCSFCLLFFQPFQRCFINYCCSKFVEVLGSKRLQLISGKNKKKACLVDRTINPLSFSPLWFEPCSGHMWESQVLLTDDQVVFLWILRFSPTFDEQSAQYK